MTPFFPRHLMWLQNSVGVVGDFQITLWPQNMAVRLYVVYYFCRRALSKSSVLLCFCKCISKATKSALKSNGLKIRFLFWLAKVGIKTGKAVRAAVMQVSSLPQQRKRVSNTFAFLPFPPLCHQYTALEVGESKDSITILLRWKSKYENWYEMSRLYRKHKHHISYFTSFHPNNVSCYLPQFPNKQTSILFSEFTQHYF